MLVVHDLVGGRSLRRQALLEPHQRPRDLRILVPQPLHELNGEGPRQGRLLVMLKDRAHRLARVPVHAQQPVGQVIRFLARGAARHDAPGAASKILHEHDPQRDRDRPQLPDRQRLNALVGAHEPAQHLRVKAAVRMSDKSPGHAKDPWIAGERSGGQLGQLPIVTRRKIVTNFSDLLFDEVVVVEQPFGGGRYGAPLSDRVGDGAIGFEQNRFVIPQPNGERAPGHRPRGDGLGRRKALGMLLKTLDTEELLADGLFVIPGCSSRCAPEGAENCRFQVRAICVIGACAQRSGHCRARISVPVGWAGKWWGIADILLNHCNVLHAPACGNYRCCPDLRGGPVPYVR